MKYILSIVILTIGLSTAGFGQYDTLGKSKTLNMYSKRGVYILPEKGEFALGINAMPFFSYIGGIFSDGGATTPDVQPATAFGDYAGIFGKYMLESHTAIRAHLNITAASDQSKYVSLKSTTIPDVLNPQYVEDVYSNVSHIYELGIGIEKHRGKGRVQGIYGVEALLGFQSSNSYFTYGNSITSEFNTPDIAIGGYSNGQRPIEDYSGEVTYFGARGFVGFEYFVAPKVSLGGEFGYSFIYSWGKNGLTVYEYWDTETLKVETVNYEYDSNGLKFMGVGTDHLYGAINLLFYF